MPRSLKKGPYIDQKLLAKIDAAEASGNKKPIKTWSRNSVITPDFVMSLIMTHNPQTLPLILQLLTISRNPVGTIFPYVYNG